MRTLKRRWRLWVRMWGATGRVVLDPQRMNLLTASAYLALSALISVPMLVLVLAGLDDPIPPKGKR